MGKTLFTTFLPHILFRMFLLVSIAMARGKFWFVGNRQADDLLLPTLLFHHHYLNYLPWCQCLWKSLSPVAPLSRDSFFWYYPFLRLSPNATFSRQCLSLTSLSVGMFFSWRFLLLPSLSLDSWHLSPFTTLPLGVSFLWQLLFFTSLLFRHLRQTSSGTLAQQCDCAEHWIAKHKKKIVAVHRHTSQVTLTQQFRHTR